MMFCIFTWIYLGRWLENYKIAKADLFLIFQIAFRRALSHWMREKIAGDTKTRE